MPPADRKQETGNSLYLNEPPLYQLLVGGKKAVIDLREDHLSRCGGGEAGPRPKAA